jgi:hypothetical protein
MTATCTDCDQLAQARAEHSQEFLGWMLAGVSFIAATWRVTRARSQVRALEDAQLVAAVQSVIVPAIDQDDDEPVEASS